MIDVRRLLVLREVADHGTVAAAAQALHLTPSAVSQALSALGRETGVVLTEPDGRRLRLTEAAHVLLGHAHRVFADLERAEADLSRHAGGRLGPVRIGAFPSALTALAAPAARTLAASEPPVEARCEQAEERACFTALARGDLDVAVSVEYPGAPQEDGPRFHRRPLLTDVLDVVLPAGHVLAGGEAVPLGRLAALDWVLGLPDTACHEVIVAACATAGFTPRAVHRTSDWTAYAALVADTGAVGLLPRLAQRELPAGVVVVPVAGPPPARHVFAATRRGAETAPATAEALRALAEVAGSIAG